MTTLPTRARIVVIGGGIIGCSTAYHLARDHRAEVLLIEQGRLTSGSTWHAAGLVGQLRSSASITKVLKYSVDLYKRLEAETGQATGWKMTGCLRLATTPDRWTEYKRLATTARSFGMEMELIGPDEVARMWPLMDTSDLIGASWLPTDGQASPSDITQALARGARMHGARIVEGVRVTGFRMAGARITHVETDQGAVECETVVNCAGQWARQVGAMAGINVPLQPVKHQYIITERIPGLSEDAPTLRDPDRRTYFKEEVGGLVMGGYEPNPQVWDTGLPGGDVPADWEFRLFGDDYDHFEQHMVEAVARIPALAEVGVKQMINGSESFTPDGNFILGRAPECANLYTGAGFNAFGIAAGGGAGWVLAEWAMTGEAPMDLWAVDILRFSGLHRNREWVRERTLEAYGKHYTVAFPHEEHTSARPRLVSPLYDRLRGQGAVFGSKLGWERPNWFAPQGVEARDAYAMGRQNWFDAVAAEHAHVRRAAGMFDQTSFAKYEVSGEGAEAALQWICAGDVGKPPGRVTYTQCLNTRGGIEADLTVARLAPDLFYIVTGTGFRAHDGDWIARHLPAGVALRDVTEDWGTLSLMGPEARRALAAVTAHDVSNAGFPFGHVRQIEVAGVPLRAIRITYVGELGWELHVPLAALAQVYDALMATGAEVRPVGYRALESLRLEKGYRAWAADITPNDTPFEAGLGWAVKLRRNIGFLGREALEAASTRPLTKRLAGFRVADPAAVLLGRETILRDGEPVGYLTSGGHGHTIGQGIGYGYVRRAGGVEEDWLVQGRYSLVVAAEEFSAEIGLRPFHDPEGTRIRA
ncbi:MAG: FAD-dependent oxidoreductase [Gemmobacter sp.]